MVAKSTERDLARRFATKMRKIWPDAKAEDVEGALAKVIFKDFAPTFVRDTFSGEVREI